MLRRLQSACNHFDWERRSAAHSPALESRHESIQQCDFMGSILSSACLSRTACPLWEGAQHERNDENDGHAFLGMLGCCLFTYVVYGTPTRRGWNGVACCQKCLFRRRARPNSDWSLMWTPETHINTRCKCMLSIAIELLLIHKKCIWVSGVKGASEPSTGFTCGILHSYLHVEATYLHIWLSEGFYFSLWCECTEKW